jgi:hypothetical protein
VVLCCLLTACNSSRSYLEHDPQNNLITSGWIDGALPFGEWNFYRADGQRWLTGSYQQGQREGTWRGRDQTGGSFFTTYKNNQLKGHLWRWDGTKRLVSWGRFHKGRQTGPWLTYEQGNLMSLGTYAQGRQHGPWFYPGDDTKIVRAGIVHHGRPIGPWLHDTSVIDRGVPDHWSVVWQQPTPHDVLWHATVDQQLTAVAHLRHNQPVLFWHAGQMLAWNNRAPQLLGQLGKNCVILEESLLPTAHITPDGQARSLNDQGVPKRNASIRLDDTDRLRSSSQQWQATLRALQETAVSNEALLPYRQLPEQRARNGRQAIWADPYLTNNDLELLRPQLPSAPIPSQTTINQPSWQQKALVATHFSDGFGTSSAEDSMVDFSASTSGRWALLLPSNKHTDGLRQSMWLANWITAGTDTNNSNEQPLLMSAGNFDPQVIANAKGLAAIDGLEASIVPDIDILHDSDFTFTDRHKLRLDRPSLLRFNQAGQPTTQVWLGKLAVPSAAAMVERTRRPDAP